MLPVSVILPVYIKVRAAELRAALDSVLQQTRPAAEVIVVADGPLRDDANEVLDEYVRASRVSVVRLAENQGITAALNAGVAASGQPWIARQDADDVSHPERFERTWRVIESSALKLVGTGMAEFEGTPDNVVGLRRMPETGPAIRRAVAFNNPFSHPTVMIERATLDAVGGYREMPPMEDYFLFARVIAAGHEVANIPDALVSFRTDGMFDRRRGGFETVRQEWRMQRELRRLGLVAWPRMLVNVAVRAGVRLLPSAAFKWLYVRRFRAHVDERPDMAAV